MVRKMTSLDAGKVAGIHMSSFPGFFLTFLGYRFLKVFYQGVCKDLSGVGFIIEELGEPVAFVAGSTQPSGFYKRLIIRDWYKYVVASIQPIIQNPKIIPKLIGALNKPNETLPSEKCATLMSIAVAPDFQGRGFGNQLVIRFLEESAIKECSGVNLTTDSLNNEPVNSFYKNVGFTLLREFSTPEGRLMNEYIYQFN